MLGSLILNNPDDNSDPSTHFNINTSNGLNYPSYPETNPNINNIYISQITQNINIDQIIYLVVSSVGFF